MENFNEQLKEVQSYNDFIQLLNRASLSGYTLVGKRRGYKAFDFRECGEKRVMYLYDDGVSCGDCRYEYLYRYLHFVI